MSGMGFSTDKTYIASVTANAQSWPIPMGDHNGVNVTISGTYGSVAIAFEATVDGTNWVAVQGVVSDGTAIVTASGTLSNTVRSYFFYIPGFSQFRVRSTAWTSGTMVVRMSTNHKVAPAVVAIAQAAGTLTVQPGNTANTTPWLVTQVPSAAQGHSTHHHLVSAATTNATSVKGSAGTIGTIVLANNAATNKYFKLFNKATAPIPGTDTPTHTFIIPAAVTTLVVDFANGMRFGTGIGYAITGAVADLDTTAIAANEVVVSMTYT